MADLSKIRLRIEEIKEKFNYTNEQLGKVCGVSYNTIAKIVNGKTQDPSVSLFIDLSQKLGISIKWLLFNEGSMFEKESKYKHSIESPSAFIKSQQEKEELLKMILKSKEEQVCILQKTFMFLENRNKELEKLVHPELHNRKEAS
jgi:transcriptional regulator with XRE-family HTH domain